MVDDSKNKAVLQSLKTKKENYQASLKEEQTKLDMAIGKSQDLDYWIYHFSKKGFMTYLTNQSIKTIETITNSYLKKFNTNLEVKIEGYKVLKNNDVREKITIWIVRNGINSGSFERYSGGEKGRVNLACIAGLQKLMNMSAKNGGFNFLGLDEVFEGLDTTGQKDVLNILETLGVTTMVVSHRNDPIGAENEIYVEKINGVNTLMRYDKN
jgi:DNA repair exonuclease SbcCD ATPase subunit